MAFDPSSNNEAIADSYSATFKTPKREEKPADLVQLAGEPPKADTKPPVEDKSGVRAQTEAQIADKQAARGYEEAKRAAAKGETAAKEAREAAVYAEYKPRLTAPYESFKPTGDTASSLASLGLMIGMLGAMGGKKGLTSATGAMNAIAGMMTGYQEGSKEKYNKERQIFEENLKVAQQNHALVEKEFERAVKYAKYDLTGATNAMIKSRLAAGDPVTAKSIGEQGLMKTASEHSQASGKIVGQLEAAKQKMYAAEDARLRAEGEVKARAAETKSEPLVPVQTAEGIVYMPRSQAEGQQVGARPSARAGGAAGGEASPNSLQSRYNNAVAGASYRLATSMTNVSELPTFAKAPGLTEMISDPAKGLTGPMERYLAQKTTPEEDRAWQQESARLLRAAGAIEAGGRPGGLTASAMKEYGNELVKPGDSRINKVLSMALLKQELDFAVQELKVSGASKDQIRLAEESKANVDKLIPYSVTDINRILRGGKSSLASSVDKNLLNSVTNKKELDNRMKIIDRIKEIPLEAKEMLLTNPTKEARDQFDTIFGKGSSYAIIGK